MSDDSIMEANVDFSDGSTRRVEVHASAELANKVLAFFEVPMPDAADLDEIRVIIRGPNDVALTETDAIDDVLQAVLNGPMPSKSLPDSPLLSDPAFVALAGEFEGINRMFNGICALLVSEGAISADNVLHTIREIKNNFGDMITFATDRHAAVDDITLKRFRDFWEMIDADFPDEK
ncbi:MAG TPA: hypothetical protein VGO43_14295 [Pyrinomonadaceae bacterium]|jgi:hypothetical protein|nr:hypothetical protein [Pyrinomonadaceae bacterium]